MQHEIEYVPKGYFSVRKLAERYGVSRSTLYKWIAEKKHPAPVRLGSRLVRFRAEDVLSFESALAPTQEPQSSDSK